MTIRKEMRCQRCNMLIEPGTELTPEQEELSMGPLCYDKYMKGIPVRISKTETKMLLGE